MRECQEAATELEKTYRFEESWKHRPKGCFSLYSNVYWNSHDTGKARDSTRAICRQTGKYNVWELLKEDKKISIPLELQNRTKHYCAQIAYSVNMDLIPRSNEKQCPKNSYYKEGLGSCSCEDHCGWDVCRLTDPPDECILGSYSKWQWDILKNGWVAQVALGDVS